MSFDHRSPRTPGRDAGGAAAPMSPGKQTLTSQLSVPLQAHGAAPGPAARTEVHAEAASADGAVATAASASSDEKWKTLFRGAPSRQVDTLARVAVPRGLHVREAPDSKKFHVTIPFNELVQIERTTTESTAAQRWAYVVAPMAGAAGFVEEGFLMWDPPEPSSKLHEVKRGETLGGIVESAYQGHIGHGHDERLYCQAVYFANRHVSGVHLDPVDLSGLDKLTRGEKERETLRIYKGVKVIADQAIWLPSNTFVKELQQQGKITSGQTDLTEAFDAAKHAVEHFVNDVEYLGGLVAGVVDGVFLAFRDLASGAVQMLQAVIKILTGDIASVIGMAKHWLGGFEQLWEHRRQVADDFFRKWNAKDSFDRGRFRGEVLGWLITNVVIVILTAGEASEGVLAGIATRFPEAVKALRAVSDLGDVTTYTKSLGKALELPENQQKYLETKVPSDVQIANQARGHAKFRNEWNDAHKIGTIASTTRSHGHKPKRFEFKLASTDELQSLADLMHGTSAWILHDTVKLSPHGLAALKTAVAGFPHHGLDGVFSGHAGHASAVVDGDTLVVIV
ncbi:MAG TPA: hypothetical protein VF469_28435 [Kofleriaceae bacterium]